MRLIDTSAWIHALRSDGDHQVALRVRRMLDAGEAAWCPMVELELWNGARGTHEKRVLSEMHIVLVNLDVDGPVWAMAQSLARSARGRGLTIPATDILIAACARRHGVEIEHADSHFDVLSGIAV
ncbi:MAG: PIN domain-containing protein [Candidatus Sumerlaeota bacterium]|nr:PIN domain-containing protein [Candidatus Sumerlaeota bacterium]